MNRLLPVLSGVLFALIGLVAGWFWGFRSGRFQAGLEENKVAASCLRAEDLTLSPDLREYLKGRIYYNLASKYPNRSGYLSKREWDFGPVNLLLLKRRFYAKDPTVPSESFGEATAHLSSAEPVQRTRASRLARRQFEQQRRLALVADLQR